MYFFHLLNFILFVKQKNLITVAKGILLLQFCVNGPGTIP